MKNYLYCSLSQEEKDLITSIIWVTAKDFKRQNYKRICKHPIIPIDDVDLSVEDEYDFSNLKTRGDFDFARPIAMIDKVRIVENVDRILSELSLYEFKIALTFDEKLVLFLYCFKKYSQSDVALLLNYNVRRIKYLNKTLKEKKEIFLGGFKNV